MNQPRHKRLSMIIGTLALAGTLGWPVIGEAGDSDRKTSISISGGKQPQGQGQGRRPAVKRPSSSADTPSIDAAAADAAAATSTSQRVRNLSSAVENRRWLIFKTDAFDPLQRRPKFPDVGPYDLTAAIYPPGSRRYHIVQFDGPVPPDGIDRLRQTGAEVLEYVPNNAYVVRLDETKRTRLDQLPNVRWVGDFEPGYKIDTSLAEAARTRAGAEEVLLRVALFQGVPADRLRAVAKAVDASVALREVRDSSRGKGRITLSIKASALGKLLATLASHPDVQWIEEYRLPELLNDQSSWVIQSGNKVSEAAPLWSHGITGAGQMFGIADSGLDTDACQARFSNTPAAQTLFNLTQPPNVNVTNPGNKVQTYYQVGAAQAYDDTSGGFHGTHTMGNAVGDNFATLATATSPGHDPGDGMAPAAMVIFQDIGRHNGSLAGLNVGQTDLQQQAHDSGARIHNNSYAVPAAFGDTNNYDLDSQDLDEAIWRLRHYTIFFAAGNDGPGPGGLGLTGSTAKNTVVVGATIHGSMGAEDTTGFSSHGPTSDGRIKPDLMAPGQSIVSANEPSPVGNQSQTSPPNNNCATSAASGTSFASPTMAGAGLLVRDYFAQGFYPSGSATPADARDPSNALVKAILINAGRNMTGQFTANDGTGGSAATIPTFGQGWGRVTLDDPLFFSGDLRELRLLNDALNGEAAVIPPAATAAIQTGQIHTFTLSNVSTIEDLRVTLNWSDPAGPTGSGVVLVNNLNLEVVDPNGILYRGNVNFVNSFSAPAGASPADNLNPVENVYLKNPPPGDYTVRVIGANVPGNGAIVPFPSNRQGYALIATGNFSYAGAPLVRFDSASLSGGKGDDSFLDRTEALDAAVTVRNRGSTDALGTMVSLSVDPQSQVPASAVVISPPMIEYGMVASKATATNTFSVALLNDGMDYSNKPLIIRVNAAASGAAITSEVFEVETMANIATIPLLDFESGLAGWTLQGASAGNGPGTVMCEASGARPTPLTELKFGKLDCVTAYTNNQDQIAFSPTVVIPTANNTQLVSLNFWHRLGTEQFFDFAQVFLDHDDDGLFDLVVDFNGPDMGQMRPFRSPLGPLFNTGRTANTALAFRLITDFSVRAFPGWFVDDVSITTKSADPIADSAQTLIAATPSTGTQGASSLNVMITGLNTNFVNGVSVASFSGSGITVNSTTVTSPTQLTANITIGAGAALGSRIITVTTGAAVASRNHLFRVVVSSLSVQVMPSSWALGIITAGSTVTTWSPATQAGGGFFTALNDGAVTEDLTIRLQGSTSWAPGAAPGANIFAMDWGQTVTPGIPPPFTNVPSAGVLLANDLAVGGVFHFDLEFRSPTTTSDFTQQGIVTTIEAQLP